MTPTLFTRRRGTRFLSDPRPGRPRRAQFAELYDSREKVASALATFGSWHLLDGEEVGERLGRSGRWIRERAKRGDLPFVKLGGGALAFDLADVQAAPRCSEARDDDDAPGGRSPRPPAFR